MGMLINGEHVPDAAVEEEFARLQTIQLAQKDFGGGSVPNQENLRLAAACAVVDRVLLRQAADEDCRPLDPHAVDVEMREQMQLNNCRAGVNEASIRRLAEQSLKIWRVADELCGEVPAPTTAEVMGLYGRFKPELGSAERAEAAHIIIHVRATRKEDQARTLIEAALAELDRGEPFAEVAERFSDCKGNGGDLGSFERGVMVEEFDEAVFALSPGERTGIFRTPFGFHIAELRSKSKGDVRDPGMAQRQIEAFLTAKRRQEALDRGMDRLRDAAVIQRVAEPQGVR